MSVTYVKFCPRCKTATALDTAICPHCGHQFRSHLVAPVAEKTIAMRSPVLPANGEKPFSPASSPRAARFFFPRPLLALVLSIVGVVLISVAVYRRSHVPRAVALPPNRPVIAVLTNTVVFQSTSDQFYAPVATQTEKDLQRWLQLQSVSGKDGQKGDFPEIVHLYRSGRILLVAAGSKGRVLETRQSCYQVKILDGLHQGETGFVPQTSVHRLDQPFPAASSQVVTIP